METEKSTEPQAAKSRYVSLGALGIGMVLAGVAAAICPADGMGIISGGLAAAGVLLLLAQFGGRRGWRFFPAAPIILALLVFAWIVWAFSRHTEYLRQARQISSVKK